MDFPETNQSGYIRLPNGWTVSVQRAAINSCDANTAEVARWRRGPTQDVRGYQTPEEVAAYIEETSTF